MKNGKKESCHSIVDRCPNIYVAEPISFILLSFFRLVFFSSFCVKWTFLYHY